MRDFLYRDHDPARDARERLLERLAKLFRDLLLRTSGDVDEAFRWLDHIGRRHGIFPDKLTLDEVKAWLERDRTLARDGQGNLRVTPRGEQRLRLDALDTVFGALQRDAAGEHRTKVDGTGGERQPETRRWRFGDPVSHVDGRTTIHNTLRRVGLGDLDVTEEDLEVFETEHSSSCATVLLVDVSHSMVLYGEDRITPAKQVAMALCELIRTRYPKDGLDVVLFGDDAVRVPVDELPWVSAGPFHTNTRGGLRLAQEILRKRRQANKRILMITDGKPSALTERDGTVYKNPFGLDERVVNKTLDEAANCRRLGIPVTTFMLTDDPVLVDFVDRFTRLNKGQAYYSRPDRLGAFVLVDYLRNRRRTVE
ncbi:MAG: VWA domain-containing protein [Planctomycetes bacterium]|nr:VWA domain-containing protein [Planctomycetota bacterium]